MSAKVNSQGRPLGEPVVIIDKKETLFVQPDGSLFSHVGWPAGPSHMRIWSEARQAYLTADDVEAVTLVPGLMTDGLALLSDSIPPRPLDSEGRLWFHNLGMCPVRLETSDPKAAGIVGHVTLRPTRPKAA